MDIVFFTEERRYQANANDFLNALYYEHSLLNVLVNRKKVYNTLLKFLLKQAKKSDGFVNYQTATSIADELQLPLKKAEQWLALMYNDIWEMNSLNPKLFKNEGYNYEYEVAFKGDQYGPYVFFTIYLRTPLQLLDGFNWPFVHPKLGSSFFYVERISHDYAGGDTVTHVDMQAGIHDPVREQLLNELYHQKTISAEERFMLPKYRVDELLKLKKSLANTNTPKHI